MFLFSILGIISITSLRLISLPNIFLIFSIFNCITLRRRTSFVSACVYFGKVGGCPFLLNGSSPYTDPAHSCDWVLCVKNTVTTILLAITIVSFISTFMIDKLLLMVFYLFNWNVIVLLQTYFALSISLVVAG